MARARRRPPLRSSRSSYPIPASKRKLDPEAVVASAAAMLRATSEQLGRLTEPWQAAAYNYYDLLGEIHYASNFYARGMTGVRFYVGERQDDGTYEETDNEDAIELLDAIRDPGGTDAGQLRENYGRIQFIAGSGYMLWSVGDDGIADEWEYVSTDELRVNDAQSFYRYRADGLVPESLLNAPDDDFEPLPDTVKVWRFWTPHPRLSFMADSPMRAVLEPCEELLLLSRVVRGRVRSRLAGNGVFYVPNEVSPPPVAVTAEGTEDVSDQAPGDEDPKADPFLADLIEHMVAPISDDGSAASVLPLLIRGPAEHADKLKHLSFRNAEEQYREQGLREEAIRRIALGLDMPPEELLGMGNLNHWSGWLIDEKTWENIRPIVRGYAANLTSVYLIPGLADRGVDDPGRYAVLYDPSDLLTDPDRGKAGDAAIDRFAIGFSAYRRARGFSDDDAPDDEELALMLAVKGAALPAPDTADTTDTEQGEPATEDSQDAGDASGDLAVERVVGAAELVVQRARELASSRLVGFSQGRCDECVELARNAGPGQVAHVLGADRLVEMGSPKPLDLVRGAAVPFVQTLQQWGVEAEVAVTLGTLVEMHAANTLLDERARPLPRAFITALRRGV